MPRIDETRAFVPLNIAVLTMSDTRTLDDDRSGDTLADRLTKAGHRLAARAIVADDVEQIRAQVKKWIADVGVDVIITTGGTGFTGRDVTPEALEPLFEKKMDGFSEVFHRISYDKIGTSTIQSRATGGVAGGTFIFVLPGSPGACRDAWDGIIAAQLDYRHRPCNFVEIMPRLDEHLRRGSTNSNVRLCPECRHVFQGKGWEGIDAHWKSKHEDIMAYEEAWPLIEAGKYRSRAG